MIKLRPSMDICQRIFTPPVTGAEIGVLGGGHACTLTEHWPGLAVLHLVDSYGGITEEDQKFIGFKKKFEPIANRLRWHIKTSLQAAGDFGNASLDFVYIDANHQYESVVSDINAWWPKVKMGGALCGHDYFTFGGVKQAVDEWAKENNIYVFSTRPDWWVFKDE